MFQFFPCSGFKLQLYAINVSCQIALSGLSWFWYTVAQCTFSMHHQSYTARYGKTFGINMQSRKGITTAQMRLARNTNQSRLFFSLFFDFLSFRLHIHFRCLFTGFPIILLICYCLTINQPREFCCCCVSGVCFVL